MITPPKLVKGDKVAFISTAKAISEIEVIKAKEWFEKWGLKVVYGKHIFNRYNQFAGTDTERLQDLQWALDNPEIKAIICTRGGYGTTKILDSINFNSFIKNPKWVVGFSDITALLSKINTLGIKCIHGTMPIFFNFDIHIDTITSLKDILLDNSSEFTFPIHEKNILGISKGELVGGNLSIICNSIGTPSELNTDNKILFLEDLTEYYYHIDRMIVHLDRSGKLSNLKGLIIGKFSKLMDNDISFGKTIEEIVLEQTKRYNYPICFNAPIGHENHNLSVIVGKKYKLEISKEKVKIY